MLRLSFQSTGCVAQLAEVQQSCIQGCRSSLVISGLSLVTCHVVSFVCRVLSCRVVSVVCRLCVVSVSFVCRRCVVCVLFVCRRCVVCVFLSCVCVCDLFCFAFPFGCFASVPCVMSFLSFCCVLCVACLLIVCFGTHSHTRGLACDPLVPLKGRGWCRRKVRGYPNFVSHSCRSAGCSLELPTLLHLHTFSAFWLRSSVVSVLISVTTDMSPTGDLLVTLIFRWGGVLSSLLRGPRVLHWPCTSASCGTPFPG